MSSHECSHLVLQFSRLYNDESNFSRNYTSLNLPRTLIDSPKQQANLSYAYLICNTQKIASDVERVHLAKFILTTKRNVHRFKKCYAHVGFFVTSVRWQLSPISPKQKIFTFPHLAEQFKLDKQKPVTPQSQLVHPPGTYPKACVAQPDYVGFCGIDFNWFGITL